jgi:hypothetical protein
MINPTLVAAEELAAQMQQLECVAWLENELHAFSRSA